MNYLKKFIKIDLILSLKRNKENKGKFKKDIKFKNKEDEYGKCINPQNLSLLDLNRAARWRPRLRNSSNVSFKNMASSSLAKSITKFRPCFSLSGHSSTPLPSSSSSFSSAAVVSSTPDPNSSSLSQPQREFLNFILSGFLLISGNDLDSCYFDCWKSRIAFWVVFLEKQRESRLSKWLLFLPGALTFGLGTWQIFRRQEKVFPFTVRFCAVLVWIIWFAVWFINFSASPQTN